MQGCRLKVIAIAIGYAALRCSNKEQHPETHRLRLTKTKNARIDLCTSPISHLL